MKATHYKAGYIRPKCKGCGRPFKVGRWDAGVQRSFANPEKCVVCDLMGVGVVKKWDDLKTNTNAKEKDKPWD